MAATDDLTDRVPVELAEDSEGVVKPGVNFINVLRAAFTLADPKSAKNCLT